MQSEKKNNEHVFSKPSNVDLAASRYKTSKSPFGDRPGSSMKVQVNPSFLVKKDSLRSGNSRDLMDEEDDKHKMAHRSILSSRSLMEGLNPDDGRRSFVRPS
mmetsp:Transcript_2275/g.3915  ORF Transcript_2275/g.3915 Transcript_2275/m.3915 type:complete len:102 (-) Transcript_2275:5-310(-)